MPRSVVRPTVPTSRLLPSSLLRNGTKIDEDTHAAPNPQSSSQIRTAARFRAKRGGAAVRSMRGPRIVRDVTAEWKVEHPLGDGARVFVPHLTPNDDNVAGDWVFRSPAVIVANDARAIAYVPDLDDV